MPYRVKVIDRWAYLEVSVGAVSADLLVPRYLATGSGVTVVGYTEHEARRRHYETWVREIVPRN